MGRQIEFARTIIRELRAIASNAPLSLPIIETYLAQLDPTVRDEVSFGGGYEIATLRACSGPAQGDRHGDEVAEKATGERNRLAVVNRD